MSSVGQTRRWQRHATRYSFPLFTLREAIQHVVTVVLYNSGDSGEIYSKRWLAVVQGTTPGHDICGGERWGCVHPHYTAEYKMLQSPNCKIPLNKIKHLSPGKKLCVMHLQYIKYIKTEVKVSIL
jgi:hypothetical protein